MCIYSQRASAKEVVEEHHESVGRREDAVVASACLRPALLQTHTLLRHGRNRRCSRLQKRFHRRQLHQGKGPITNIKTLLRGESSMNV